MRKFLFIWLLVFILVAVATITTACIFNPPTNSTESTELVIDPSEWFVTDETIPQITYKDIICKYFNTTIKYKESLTKEEIVREQERIEEYCLSLYDAVYNEIDEADITAGLEYIQPEVRRARSIYDKYVANYDALVAAEIEAEKWQKRMEEYPTATAVWMYLTEAMGCNKYVAAGIIGNMMAECGGQTLRLNWKALNSTGHYGLCQWSTGFTAVRGADLQGQLDFMAVSFPEQIDRWGDICYKDGFTYEDFMAMEDAAEAAYAFCVIYERPGPGSYNQRRANALKALEYFTS